MVNEPASKQVAQKFLQLLKEVVEKFMSDSPDKQLVTTSINDIKTLLQNNTNEWQKADIPRNDLDRYLHEVEKALKKPMNLSPNNDFKLKKK
ncbi:MAG: hypothetical protein IGR80_13355 [Synechococcales cyanobacterium K44_A2020_017]|nr:hypothetical protein [Synechococcales cyanobacterium K32_A2020_035]MBF2095730.1 hypothetical protein [Synechococcales cyanobacterium K44_A2020_017]